MNPENISSDVASAPGYEHDDLIIAAISKINDGNGVDIDGILEVFEEKYELPPDYRKVLDEDLKNLVSQNKLEKVETRYKILDATVTQATNPTQILNPQELLRTSLSSQESLEKTEAAANAVAVAENKDFEAKKASEFADTTKKLYEESALILQIAKEVHDRCAKGEKVILP